MVLDQVTATMVAIFVPELWAAAMLLIVVESLWTSLRAGSKLNTPLALVMPVVMVVVGFVQRPVGWISVSAVAVFLVVLFNAMSVRMQAVVRDREEDLAQALSTSGAIVHISNIDSGKVDLVEGPIHELMGWSPEQWVTLDHGELVHPDDYDAFWIDQSMVSEGDIVDRKGRMRRADGTYAWIRDVSRIVWNGSGQLTLRGISMDVTEIEDAQAVIRHQAETDALTGLANRSVLTNELERRLQARSSFGLVLLDLDRFKKINDTLGHGFGDGVLVEIADRLVAVASDDDVVVRLGGDEFAIIVSSMSSDAEASLFAARVAEALNRAMSLQGVTLTSSASIGIALAPRDGDTAKTLMRHADISMYAAKRKRSQFQIFNTAIQQAPLEEVMLSADIGPALDNGELVLHFQSKVNTVTGEVTGFEGLARWDHPTFGQLSPDRFVHLVMLSNFATTFSERMLDLGGQFAARCEAKGRPVPISVNISARTLYDSTFPDRVARVLNRHHLKSNQLVIEITEHDIMNRTSDESGVLARLGRLGVALSIDDFGTGYSSLGRLVDLPVSEIKIDRSFVARLLDDERDAVVVRSIIELGRNLDLHVVAEGIEQAAEAEMLHGYGCHHAQGFLYSRPVPPDEALVLLDQNAPHVPSNLIPIHKPVNW